ncbi:MAG: dephospho-CoA kinase [Candidatus Muproteobacteria bacterium RIFCSPHIGHO2_01_FULL_65_16]|uniref:Dephospho-CoA kinase n=2 Tax=Candidatus Muproteobacteria TaxID=1817795 RepID=A0A1F6TKB1_9PROT|nr:MAG: dephospho-CoA kinase [Candidatus Muproteobacteria bacterium RIFCSPHIGHO2_01_FULL_65_16]OGI51264.1 MAG: dephospho-CoA kinase [Candidatus Muproteobacteria bacterium RIFCSPHIGHO2_02_FULL_65_16]
MLRVGLTGGIGSGKSTVAALFARHGAPVIDTDAIARALAAPGAPAHREIVQAFGRTVLDAAGEIDRRRLRRLVFDNPAERHRLEDILHPLIREEVRRRLGALTARYCILVLPLLFEAGFTDLADRVLVVDADEALQIRRACARGAMDETEVRKIMAAQLPRAERRKRADDIILNEADSAHLEREVARLHTLYLSLAGDRKRNRQD